MGIFVVSLGLVDGLSVGLMLKSMLIVTIGNMVGGALLLAYFAGFINNKLTIPMGQMFMQRSPAWLRNLRKL